MSLYAAMLNGESSTISIVLSCDVAVKSEVMESLEIYCGNEFLNSAWEWMTVGGREFTAISESSILFSSSSLLRERLEGMSFESLSL